MIERAMSFPFRISELGAATLVDRRQLVRDAIEQLLLTMPGERVNRPDFGCGVQRLVFDGTDTLALAAAEYVITTSIRKHLRDLVVLDAVRVGVDDSTLLIDILYTVAETGEESALTITQPLETAR